MNISINFHKSKIINNIINDVYFSIKNLIDLYNINKIFISFSGGIDSTVLLNLIFFIKNNILNSIDLIAIHINHNINKYSINWQEHCINECSKKNIKLIIEDIYISQNDIKKYGIEYASRILRYKKIYEVLDNNKLLFVGHNKNDQLETFFLALKRGSGTKGLSSMQIYKDNIYGCKIIRPLLSYTRNNIEEYAKTFDLKWVDDISNNNEFIERNFIRNKIIKTIQNRWPYFIDTASRSINICFQQEILLKNFFNKELKKIIKLDNSLYLDNLIKKDKYYIFSILKCWLEIFNINLVSYNLINRIYEELINTNKTYLEIKVTNYISIKKYKNNIFYINQKFNNIKLVYILWNNINEKINLPYELGYLILSKEKKYYNKENLKCVHKIRKNNFDENIIVKISIPNSTKINNFNNKIKIKNIWQNYKIKPWDRNKIPILFYDKKIISILSLLVTEEGKIKNNKDKLYLFWYL